jgi:hypothetical protein
MLIKRIAALVSPLLIWSNLHAQTPDIKQKVDQLISQMTIDEKIGQMTQVTLAVVAKGGWANEDGSLQLNALPAKYRNGGYKKS